MDIENDHVIIKKEDVLERSGDDLLLFDSSIGKLFEVNETGKTIWKFLDEEHNVREIKEKLNDEYKGIKTLEQDLLSFLNRLLELDLIEIKFN